MKLRIFDDELNEEEEKFVIHLQRQTGNTPCYNIGNGNRTVTIIDDDGVLKYCSHVLSFILQYYHIVSFPQLSVYPLNKKGIL